jgi:hypothetical protein
VLNITLPNSGVWRNHPHHDFSPFISGLSVPILPSFVSSLRLPSLSSQAPRINNQAHYHQPQMVRLPASMVRLATTCYQGRLTYHLPPCQSLDKTSLHIAVWDRHTSIPTLHLPYTQLSETDVLLFPLHTFFTYSCLRQTHFYSHSTVPLFITCTSLLSDICAPLQCHENTY